MSNHYYMKIGSLEMAIAILSGDVERVETLLAYVLYDAFRYDDRQDLFV